ncbi:hypothetical protein M422DRAFT_190730 [Sphaerobolus stellatus SS14]|uniref:CHAT domain-containing protein n=1 Tax=Sphaerobolus stellatus (strain SS14) TaxID=990650 RepID=A0A0C9UQI9_SPHS4|nr:hypothetical protein M422DRAFT_190730 [Sphaerobolus stellatus SS14]
MVNLIPDGNSAKANFLKKLGNSFERRFSHLNDIEDINNAIIAKQKAMDLIPDGHPDKVTYLNDLGASLEIRFDHLGGVKDLENVIAVQQQAVDLTPDGHPLKVVYLNNLGISLERCFERLGEIENLDKAITVHQQALHLTPDGHPHKVACLENLGSSWSARFNCLGQIDDLEKAIAVQQHAAVDLIPDGHSHKARYLTNLGASLESRFDHLGKVEDLANAIAAQQQAVDLLPDGHLDKIDCLNNLGNSLESRFHCLGEVNDLENAIAAKQQAVKLTPDGHPGQARWLNHLGTSFHSRFDYLGTIKDLDNAIAVQWQAVKLVSDDHPDMVGCLQNLGTSLASRFNCLGEVEDLNNAISAQQRVISLIPDGHVETARSLNNLGNSLDSRFKCLGDVKDLDHAITVQRQAVKLTKDDNPNKALYLNNLAISLESRFDHLREVKDLDDAIVAKQKAVDLTPDDHPYWATCLNSLGNSLYNRFNCLGIIEDLNNAIATQQEAMDLTPDGHPEKARCLNNLGLSLQRRLKHLGHMEDLDSAIAFFSRSANNTSGSAAERYFGAIRWANLCSEYERPSSALEAYNVTLEIIPELAWIGLKVATRYNKLSDIGDISNAAAALAISNQDLPLALEWLEQGRSIVWGQILQFRTPLEDLQLHEPDLAEDLLNVSRALENAGTSRDKVYSHNDDFRQLIETEAQKHRALAVKYKSLLEQVRSLDGFESFLKPKRLPALLHASKNCPVVLITISNSRCDALILHSYKPSEPIVHVPLQEFSLAQANLLYSQLNTSLHSHNARYSRKLLIDDRAIPDKAKVLQSVLANLWTWVVHPVLLELQHMLTDSRDENKLHITWCPTGPLAFLPLHAAGIYNSEDPAKNTSILDIAVSSYTPTLALLLRTPVKHVEMIGTLIVSQSKTPGQRALPGTIKEAEVILKHLSANTTLHLKDENATIVNVLDAMGQHSWVHLACHGIQNTQNSLKSAFALQDGKLDLQALMAISFNHAELAFLSACQTATGDEQLPEEAAHLAAGILAVGFRSVVATMWSIHDADAPTVAETFYSTLLREPRREDGTLNVVYALHEGVRKLRENIGLERFERWVPFVHLGL